MGGLSLEMCLLHFVTISFPKSFYNHFQNASMVFHNVFDMAAVDVNYFFPIIPTQCVEDKATLILFAFESSRILK